MKWLNLNSQFLHGNGRYPLATLKHKSERNDLKPPFLWTRQDLLEFRGISSLPWAHIPRRLILPVDPGLLSSDKMVLLFRSERHNHVKHIAALCHFVGLLLIGGTRGIQLGARKSRPSSGTMRRTVVFGKHRALLISQDDECWVSLRKFKNRIGRIVLFSSSRARIILNRVLLESTRGAMRPPDRYPRVFHRFVRSFYRADSKIE
jgi:hypothetical protein